MRIAHVIHGFPPEYMAGSEVYTYNVVKELSKGHDLSVFTRVANTYKDPYETEIQERDRYRVYRVNNLARYAIFKSRYRDEVIEEKFEEFLDMARPEVVHFGHLNHLSTALVLQAKERGLPVIFTLHDFWLICQRGQFIKGDLTICEGQKDEKCSGCLASWMREKNTLEEIQKRMRYLKKVIASVDIFIAPSRFLMGKFLEFGIPEDKIVYSDYGFNTSYFEGFEKRKTNALTFGYIGTLIRTKGVNVLIKAFNGIDREDVKLKIYGRTLPDTKYLKAMVKNENIEFAGEYENWEVADVLAGLDAVVVPSVWYENSPLVIHEAFMAKMPVVASNLGGMAEYVHHMENGLLFELGNADDLREKVLTLADSPDLVRELGENAPEVKCMEDHAGELLEIYRQFV